MLPILLMRGWRGAGVLLFYLAHGAAWEPRIAGQEAQVHCRAAGEQGPEQGVGS